AFEKVYRDKPSKCNAANCVLWISNARKQQSSSWKYLKIARYSINISSRISLFSGILSNK
ncbi:MAG: hypothetical protein WD334_12650, partial [Chitinophagales bacterium]